MYAGKLNINVVGCAAKKPVCIGREGIEKSVVTIASACNPHGTFSSSCSTTDLDSLS